MRLTIAQQWGFPGWQMPNDPTDVHSANWYENIQQTRVLSPIQISTDSVIESEQIA